MTHAPRRPGPADAWEETLRIHGLSFPQATEDFPWGHRALKVKGKAFVFMAREGDELSLSVKLPQSQAVALMLPFAEPTGYGLGKSGWVSARFAKAEKPPLDVLKLWIEESYRAVAPRTLVKAMDGTPPAAAPARKAAAPKRKAVRKGAAPPRAKARR
jgi:predicted DNA-binding protein (MmcQ/YjbR family)